MANNDKRGLASASKQTRERVAKAGGNAPHDVRGFQAMDEETHHDISVKGGKSSHGGGRNQSNQQESQNDDNQGQGWFDDSAEHAEVGKLGGEK